MKRKEINLVPSYAAFDFKVYVSIRIFTVLILLNIFILLVVYGGEVYSNIVLKRYIDKQQAYLNSLKPIESSLASYKSVYNKLVRRLQKVKDEENYIRHLTFVHQSAFASSVVFLNTFCSGVYFKSVNYSNGFFNVEGFTNSSLSFEMFYKGIEVNPYIKNARFFYIKRKGNSYLFKVAYEVRY